MTLGELQTQLVALGVDVGTPDKLMNSDITLTKLYSAAAQVMTNKGQLAQATALNALSASASGSAKVKLNKLVDVSQGIDNSVLSARIDAFELVVGSAEAANGTNFVTIPNLAVTIPGVGQTALSLQLIEAPKTVRGPIGTSVHTAQASLTLTPFVNKTVSLPVVGNASLSGNLPVVVTGGGADGTLTAAQCQGAQSMTISVTPHIYSTTSTSTLSLTAPVPPMNLGLGASASQSQSGSTTPLTFAWPSEKDVTKRAGSTTVGMGSLNYAVTINSGSLPLGLLANQVTTAVSGALTPVVSTLDSYISPLMRELGISLGGGDVKALDLLCTGAGLVS
jgi:uncharacterized membrane protein